MRIAAFAVVGVLGFLLQILVVAGLLAAGWHYLPATAVAVEAAVLHNFVWHERWTWADRTSGAPGAASRLLRFNLTTGSTSIAGNIAFTALYVGLFGLNPIVANALAVISTTVANFLVADRYVFGRAALIVLVLGGPSRAAAAELKPETITAWNQYVKVAEARMQRELHQGSTVPSTEPDGELIVIPSGLIHHWRDAVFIPGATLDHLLDGLLHPGTPPPQADVLASRVLARSSDSLRVHVRLVRSTVVTVTYDTEHDMTFRRHSPTFASSRSEATRIVEVEDAGTQRERARAPGEDHGFLWRLNSYWRYSEVNGGVWVELESLTLSRDLPSLLRPIAAPLINRVARESIARTLQALAHRFETLVTAARWP